MQTEKLITYSAMGVAGMICLLFLLDLVAGIFGRNITMDILFILGGVFPALAGSRDDFRAPLTGVRFGCQLTPREHEVPRLHDSLGHAHEDVSMAPKSLEYHITTCDVIRGAAVEIGENRRRTRDQCPLLDRDTIHNGPYQDFPGINPRTRRRRPIRVGSRFRRHGTQGGHLT